MPFETWWEEGVKDSFSDLCHAMDVKVDLDAKFTISAILRYFSEFYPCYDAKVQFEAALYNITKRSVANITGRDSAEDKKIISAIYARLYYKVAPVFEKFVFPSTLAKGEKRPNMDGIDLAAMIQELESVIAEYQTLEQDSNLDDKDKAFAKEAYEVVSKEVIAEAELIMKDSVSYFSLKTDPIEAALLQAELAAENKTFETEMVDLFAAISKEPVALTKGKPNEVKVSEELRKYLSRQLRGALVSKIGAEAKKLLAMFDEIHDEYPGNKQDIQDLKEFLVEAKHSDNYVEYIKKLNIVFLVMNEPGAVSDMSADNRSKLQDQKSRMLRLISEYKKLPISANEPDVLDKNTYSLIVAVLGNNVDPLLFQGLLSYLQPEATIRMELERLATGASIRSEQKSEVIANRTEYPAELKNVQNLPKLIIVAIYFVMSKQDVAPDEKEFQAFIDKLNSEVRETKDLDLSRAELAKITNILFKHLMSSNTKSKDAPKKMLFTPEEGGINGAMQTIAQRKKALEESRQEKEKERTLKHRIDLNEEQRIAQLRSPDDRHGNGGGRRS